MASSISRALVVAAAVAMAFTAAPAQAQWEPTRPVEFIIPAGTGGGADIMARTIQGIVIKYNLMNQPLLPINRAGGAGGEGFLDVKNSKGNPHKIIITLSNLFTTPLATGIPFNWKDLTPVAMLALDEFVLWVHSDSPHKTAKDFIAAAKEANGKMRMAGTGSRQEDQIVTVAIEREAGVKFIYIPQGGGGAVAVQLVGKHVDSTVNNPNEAVTHWRSGALRPLCVFDAEPMPYKDVIADGKSWGDIPTCKSEGLDIEYLMLRGIFTTPGASQEVVDFYVNLFQKVRETQEWQDLMKNGAFNQSFMTGDEYVKWVTDAEETHRNLMKEAGFLAK